MNSLLHDLRFTVRMIRKNPIASAVIVLSLGLGIGGNTAMFAGFDAWVLRPLDFPHPEELLEVHESLPRHEKIGRRVAPANLRDWQQQSRCLAGIAPYNRAVFNFHDENDPERVKGARIDAALFPLLGVEPARGRLFSPAEDVPNGPAVALVSHSLWQSRFEGDPAILGRIVRLDGHPHEVIGVMPPDFEYPEVAQVWTPLALGPNPTERGWRHLQVAARLAAGFTLEDARTELAAIAGRLAELHPETNAGWSATAIPLREKWSPPIIRLALTCTVAAAGFVLLVICANVASLMLAQANGRQREVALRAALGAGRGRLARQTLTESVVLSLAGGVLGAILGVWWVDWMKSWVPVEVPYLFRFDVDGRALGFTLAVALVTGAACALAPVFRSTGFDVAETLKSGGRTGTAKGGRLRSSLVVAEFAVSMLLVIGALLMVKSFYREQQIDSGYRSDDVLTARLSLTGQGYEEGADRAAALDRILDAVAGLGEVEAAGATSELPADGGVSVRLEAEGRPREPGEEQRAAFYSVTRGYLESLEIPFVAGRGFTAGEAEGGGDVVVVSRSLAGLLWPGEGAVDRRLRLLGDDEEPWRRVIGVVGDIDPGHSMVADERPRTQIYLPYADSAFTGVTVAIASGADPELLVPALRDALRAAAPGVPVSKVLTLPQAIDEVHWVSRVFSQMFALYAVIALAIAALGAYGVTSDSVSRRSHEMGIRMALGARPADVLKMVIGQGLGLAALGVVLGLVGAVPTTRALTSMLYEVSANDPAVFAGVAVVLTLVALAAAYVPARRAARVSPVEVLHSE